jgi:hypothetical protein
MTLTWRATVVLFGLLPALVVGGCTKSAKHNTPTGSPSTATPAQAPLTAAEATTLLAEISRKNNQANATFDSGLLDEYEAESSFRIDDAIYRIGRVLDPQHKDPLKPFDYADPMFFIPRSTGYPQWIAANVSITGSKRRYLLVLTREAAVKPWKLVVQGTIDGDLPTIAKDSTGSAVAAAADDGTNLVAAPKDVAAAHAAYLTAGRTVAQAAMFASDEHSTAIVNDGELRKAFLFVNKKTGVIAPAQFYTRTITVEPYPVRVLRTTDGGALACYVTKRQVVAEQPDGLTKLAGADAALAGRKDFDRRVTVTWLDQWVVRIPPKNGGKVTVVAHQDGKESVS